MYVCMYGRVPLGSHMCCSLDLSRSFSCCMVYSCFTCLFWLNSCCKGRIACLARSSERSSAYCETLREQKDSCARWCGRARSRYGMVWHGMAWYGMVWHGMVWYGNACNVMYVCVHRNVM